MSLIDNHVYPLDFTKDGTILDNELISREQDLELTPADLLLVLFSSIRRSLVNNSLDTRRPLLEFIVPVGKSTRLKN